MDYGGRRYSVEEIRAMKLNGAAYIRMSTDLQVDSPAIQEEKIRAFAARYNIRIVKLYIDRGISGMTAEARPQFNALLRDVDGGRNNFQIVLYLDESRWGRFINSRDAEYYRTLLEHKNVLCRPCDKDLSLTSELGDRIMAILHDEAASYYSRQLSHKVFDGHKIKILQGFKQGGQAGYGLRRMLVSETGEHKQILENGERKSLQTERIILVPGPEKEINTIHWIYDQFLDGSSMQGIANRLNEAGLLNGSGRQWKAQNIKEILTNPKYIGDNVYNRVSGKLKSKPRPNPRQEWIIKEEAFTPLIARERFEQVQQIFLKSWDDTPDDVLLANISRLYEATGKLTTIIIDEAEDLPSYSYLKARFGGIVRIYQLIGYTPPYNLDFLKVNQHLRQLHKDIVDDTVARISELCGRTIYVDPKTSLLHINFHLTVSIVVSRCCKLESGLRRWKIHFDTKLKPDITVVVRMDDRNENIHDYYILPKFVCNSKLLKLSDDNGGLLDTFRAKSMDTVFRLSMNIQLQEAVQYASKYRANHSHCRHQHHQPQNQTTDNR